MCHINIWYYVRCLHIDQTDSSIILCRKAFLTGYQCSNKKSELLCFPKFGKCSPCKSKQPRCCRYRESELSSIDANQQLDRRHDWHWGLSDRIREQKQTLLFEWEQDICFGDVACALQWIGNVSGLIRAVRKEYFLEYKN